MTAPILIRLSTPADATVIAGFNTRLAQETEHLQLDPTRLRAGVDAVLTDTSKDTY